MKPERVQQARMTAVRRRGQTNVIAYGRTRVTMKNGSACVWWSVSTATSAAAKEKKQRSSSPEGPHTAQDCESTIPRRHKRAIQANLKLAQAKRMKSVFEKHRPRRPRQITATTYGTSKRNLSRAEAAAKRSSADLPSGGPPGSTGTLHPRGIDGRLPSIFI